MSFNKTTYNNAYNKQNYIGVSFRINRTTEKDVADALKAVDNIKAYICKLIRADVKKKQRRAGWAMNRGDKKVHADFKRYPFEVVELLAFNDRYTVGFAEDLDAAHAMLAHYQARNQECGPLAVYHRFHDPDLNVIASVQVVE